MTEDAANSILRGKAPVHCGYCRREFPAFRTTWFPSTMYAQCWDCLGKEIIGQLLEHNHWFDSMRGHVRKRARWFLEQAR